MKLTFTSIGLFAFLLVTQILGASLLPRTAGFTDLYWTAACLATYLVSLWSFAYILHSGMPLSTLIPILAATVPLATIFVGIIFYKETASVTKIVILCSTCVAVGVASSLK